MPLLVELARLQEMFTSSLCDGGVVLCKLLRTPSRLASMSDVLACQVLLYGDKNIPHEDAPGRAGESVVQAEAEGG